MEWFYVVNDERKGPVSESEFDALVKDNEITNETLVWNSDMKDWEIYGIINKNIPPKIPVQVNLGEKSKKDIQEEKTFGILCHLSTFAGFMIPFGSILGPLIVWLVKKNEYELVDSCGKESLNFQISLTIYTLILLFFFFIVFLSQTEIIVVFLVPVMIIVFLVDIICVIKASVLANNGEVYRYPLTIRFFK
ncbi:MAG: DUF4870 domain-containing protein [Desulfobacterales bacterium]|nr:DUF4870 domain-containing protein [Desulfobacterales bacterium]